MRHDLAYGLILLAAVGLLLYGRLWMRRQHRERHSHTRINIVDQPESSDEPS
jgi:hypothetical protein